MAFEKNEVRQFPTKESFLGEKKMDDRVYGYMQSNSYLTEEKVRYCWKTEMSPAKILQGLGKNRVNEDADAEEQESKNTLPCEKNIRDMIKILKTTNFIDDGTIGKRKIYIINEIEIGNYVFIKTKTLKYLVDSANQNVIKVYAYLKYKWEIHKKGRFSEQYKFTSTELLNMLGYAASHKREYDMIDNILNSLINEGLIKIHDYQVDMGSGRKTWYHFLDGVSEDYKQNNLHRQTKKSENEKKKEEEYSKYPMDHLLTEKEFRETKF